MSDAGGGDPTQAVPPVDDGAYDATQALPPTPGADDVPPGGPDEPYEPYADDGEGEGGGGWRSPIVIVLIILMVIAMDWLSGILRRRLIKGSDG